MRKFFGIKIIILTFIFVIFAVALQQASAAKSNRGAPIKVMTQNLYIGGDLDEIVEAQSPEELQFAIVEFLCAVEQTNFMERVEVIADTIKRQRPDLVGLQEVTIFDVEPLDVPLGFPSCDFVELGVSMDYLTLLLDALEARGLDYKAVAEVKNTEVELFGTKVVDRDVMLARKNVNILEGSAVGSNYFCYLPYVPGCLTIPSPIGGSFEVIRGYNIVEAEVRGKVYRVVNTHFEGDSEAPQALVQATQAFQLINLVIPYLELNRGVLPLIVMGDFNSPPPDDEPLPFPLPFPLDTPYAQFETAGYLDTWLERFWPKRKVGDGFTCCQDKNLLNDESDLTSRIDQIWVRTENASIGIHDLWVGAQVVGDKPRDKTPSGLWPSDHAGVVARILMK